VADFDILMVRNNPYMQGVIPLVESEEDASREEEHTTSSRLWTPYGDPAGGPGGDPHGSGVEDTPGAATEGDEISEEELRKRVEEAMEKITVTDVVVDMIVSLSSLAYQRMGIPHEVNEKYRDMDQARLAIDSVDALMKTLEGKLPDDMLEPLAGTLANLKLNFAKES
jgi:Domain of unknown function (DUF1844)